jgi:APA family basic amino acid/polyamine antiporter
MGICAYIYQNPFKSLIKLTRGMRASGQGHPAFAKKPVSLILEEAECKKGLRRALGPIDLISIGIGGIIGAGIFVIIGVGAQNAGPAIIISLILGGLACTFTALCYSELAAMIPASGCIYTYTYATLGELVAWVIGWDMLMVYILTASTVAKGFSGYLVGLLRVASISLPEWMVKDPWDGGILDLPAAIIIALLMVIVLAGIKESVKVTKAMVAIKIAVVLLVIGAGTFYIDPGNWIPFAPFGLPGILSVTATMFFAFPGFDIVASAAEESKNPQRDLPLGILGSMAICTLIYVAMGIVITGMVPLDRIDTISPVASAFVDVGLHQISVIISAGALAGFISVIMCNLLIQTRLCMAIARDGLLPAWAAHVHPTLGTPVRATVVSGFLALVSSAFFPIGKLADTTVIGYLLSFVIVCGGVLLLRKHQPDLARPFKCPGVPWIPLAGLVSCLGIMVQLPGSTWLGMLVWTGLGLLIYISYGWCNSRLRSLKRPEGDIP